MKANGIGLRHDSVTGKPKFRLYSYEQQREGVPGGGSNYTTRERDRCSMRWRSTRPVTARKPVRFAFETCSVPFTPEALERRQRVKNDRSSIQ